MSVQDGKHKAPIKMMHVPEEANLQDYKTLEAHNERLLDIINQLQAYANELVFELDLRTDLYTDKDETARVLMNQVKRFVAAVDILKLKPEVIELNEEDYNKFMKAIEQSPLPEDKTE